MCLALSMCVLCVQRRVQRVSRIRMTIGATYVLPPSEYGHFFGPKFFRLRAHGARAPFSMGSRGAPRVSPGPPNGGSRYRVRLSVCLSSPGPVSVRPSPSVPPSHLGRPWAFPCPPKCCARARLCASVFARARVSIPPLDGNHPFLGISLSMVFPCPLRGTQRVGGPQTPDLKQFIRGYKEGPLVARRRRPFWNGTRGPGSPTALISNTGPARPPPGHATPTPSPTRT